MLRRHHDVANQPRHELDVLPPVVWRSRLGAAGDFQTLRDQQHAQRVRRPEQYGKARLGQPDSHRLLPRLERLPKIFRAGDTVWFRFVGHKNSSPKLKVKSRRSKCSRRLKVESLRVFKIQPSTLDFGPPFDFQLSTVNRTATFADRTGTPGRPPAAPAPPG